MDPNECPMCDRGAVSVWRVAATEEIIRVCDACDAVWEADDELPGPATTTVDQFLAVRGRPPLWTELQAVV